MARMIPSRIHPETPSSEKKVFERIERDPETDDWVVLHSLGLSRRGNLPYGEIDFVVLVPGEGVVCLEVKGGRIRCADGVWYTQNRHGRESALTRSPFQQAREAMFGLRDAVGSHFGAAAEPSRLLYASAVVFPDVDTPPGTPEFEPWEAIDLSDLRAPISTAIRRVLREEARRVGGSSRSHHASATVLKDLRNYLRPDFDVGVARATTIRRSEERIVRLTEEQYDVLDLFERNDRCLVEGAAGTGKTMLALEFARRMAVGGTRTLLLCYNRLLGQWLERNAGEFGQGVLTAGTFHRKLRDVIIESPVGDEFRSVERKAQESGRLDDLFRVAYPLYGQLAVTELDQRPEVLVVDEAQDLLRPDILDVLNDWIVGGLAGGRWVMLGDLTRQAIFDSGGGERSVLYRLSTYAPHYTTAVLRKNCRNTRRIGEETALLSGFESLPYRLDREDCLPVDYRYRNDRDHERRRLEDVLMALRSDGVSPEDVLILSPRRYEHSVASEVKSVRIAPVEDLDRDTSDVRFSTIHAFKGLESPVVIICDLDSLKEEQERALLYVGMSRARSHLILLLKQGLQSVVTEAIARKLEKGWER